jgi:hypothetical protein
MKLYYLILFLTFLRCQAKYVLYERNSSELHEQVGLNIKNGLFDYQADSSNISFTAKGSLELIDSVITLEFPEYAEIALLSPFKKGYSKLVKINESDSIEIEMTYFDVRSRIKFGPNRHFQPSFEILSLEDSSLIRKVLYPNTRINDIGNKLLIRSKFPGYYDQYVQISEQGSYNLYLFLQPIQTLLSDEGFSGPMLQLRTMGTVNKLVKTLVKEGESYVTYPKVEETYSLVGIEKRKIRIFQ